MKSLVVIIVSFFSVILWGSSEQYVIGITGEEIQAVWDESEAYSLISLEDPLAHVMPGDASSIIRANAPKTHLSAKLWYEDALMAYHSDDWTITVNYYIELIDSETGDIETFYESLTIDYAPDGIYTDIQIRDYPGYMSANIILDNVEVDTDIPGFHIPKDVRLDLVLEADRHYKLQPGQTGFTVMTPSNTADAIDYVATYFDGTVETINTGVRGLPVMWKQIPEARSYDLEWLFVDCLHEQHHDPGSGYPYFNPEIDFRNATRVNVSTNYYEIPLGYPEGYLILRIRPVSVAMHDMATRTEGEWTLTNTTVPTLADALAFSDGSSHFIFAFDGVESGLNWQYSAGFAEEGKRKESLSFFDGALRTRQSMTFLNTDDNAMIAESHYDFQGRPALQVLPSPLTNQGLQFYANLNGDYDKQDFDTNYYFTPTLTPLPGEEGGHHYFSSSNTDLDGVHEAYVPDAEGYPFARAIYTNDGTNRLAVQSGAGKAHKIVDPLGEDDHTQKVYYTVPTQTELDRLFGNNAGIAKHYQKIVTKDANGQHTVTYLDQEGRTVANALLGGSFAETHLVDLDGRPDIANLNSDLMVNNESVEDGIQNYTLASSTFSVPLADPRVFNYSITPDYFVSCSDDHLYCEYDLSILVYNEFGELVIDFDTVETNLGTTPLINPITSENYADYTVSWTINFEPGTYQIIKKLTIDESSIQLAHDELLGELEAFNPVIGLLTDDDPGSLFADENFQLNYSINDGPAAPLSSVAASTLLSTYSIRVGGIDPGDASYCVDFDYDVPLCDCAEATDIEEGEECPDPLTDYQTRDCYDIYWEMIADLSPGGQYFDNLPARFISEYGVLVENTNYDYEIDAWLDAKVERHYAYEGETDDLVHAACWNELGIDAAQPNVGISGCTTSVINIYKALALIPADAPLDWSMIRSSWQTDWNEQWPALEGVTFDPEHGYLPLDENGAFSSELKNSLKALDDLFHLHPEAMSFENVCDVRAYDKYIDVRDKCLSNLSLPDKESIDFLHLLNSVSGEDSTDVDGESILTAADLGLFYAPFDFYGGANLYYPECPPGVLDPDHVNLTCPGFDLDPTTYHIQNVGDPEPDFTELGDYIAMSFTEHDTYAPDTWINEVKDPMSCEERELLVDHLMHFMPLANDGDFMSIYAVLDDPLGVANRVGDAYETYEANEYIGDPQIEAIRAIHDLFHVHGLSKWDFFKSNYLFFREKVNRKTAFHVSGRVNDNDTIPTLPNSTGYDLHTTDKSFIHQGDLSNVFSNETEIPYGVMGGYRLYFPHNPIFDNDFESHDDLTDGYAESCVTECAIRVAFVLEDLQNWITDNGMTPMTAEQYDNLEVELLEICENGCTTSWAEMSPEELEAITSYFDADINYYSYTEGESTTTFTDAITLANPAWSAFSYTELDLSETATLDYSAQSMGDCSCGLMETYVYVHYTSIFGTPLSEVAPDVTEENFTLYDTDLSNVPAYIDLPQLWDELNTNPQFMDEESFILYPTNDDLLDLLAYCHAADKDYCANSDDQNTCYDAIVTGTTTLAPGDLGYIYPLREAFLCAFNNPTMDELNDWECLGLWELELDNAMADFHNQIEAVMSDFYGNMLLAGLAAQETFTMDYGLDEFAYTLYYYDQAGNLVQTVPPSGVEILPYDANNVIGDENYTVQDVIAHRENEDHPFILPAHTLKTQYKYNTLNNLRESSTPDGGTSHFYYDALGRLIASQNARQHAEANTTYSYTFYDRLGRPYESGEVQGVDSELTQAIAASMTTAEFEAWVNSETQKYDVVMTFYDDHTPYEEIAAIFGDSPRYIRNRVAGVIYYANIDNVDPEFDMDEYSSGAYYSYDIHGNVNRIVQVNNSLKPLNQHLKTIDYTYDLVSGNVNQIVYQAGEWDQFHYKYEYDADNRLTYAFSSQDGRIWEKESRQHYYEHGPLARVEIGDKQVQAEDFAYTIQGWLKGVNSSTRKANRDIGKDGHEASDNAHAHFGKDAFGYHLSYYQNANYADYSSIGASAGEDYFLPAHGGMSEAQRRDLYNGNISMMVYTMSGNDVDVKTQTTATRFYYDQLNRIKSAGSFVANEASMIADNDLSFAVISPHFTSTYEYDFNGNIMKLVRTGNNLENLFMDALKYQYAYVNDKLVSNRLRHVNDPLVSDDAYTNDIDDHGAYDSQDESSFNYAYDETGQLIQDKAEYIEEIQWTITGKVKAIKRGLFDDDIIDGNYPADIAFEYDAFGNRIVKIVKPRNEYGLLTAPHDWTYTYYARDAQGNPLTTYETSFEPSADPDYSHLITLSQEDMHLYGSGRLGLKNLYRTVSNKVNTGYDSYDTEYDDNGTLPTIFIDELDASLNYDPDQHTRRLGLSSYELTDHRGNIYNVVSDRKIVDEHEGSSVLAYAPDLQAATDYFPFGMAMPGRSFVDEGYRYGFQGQEKDDEVKGDGNSVNYKYRMHDPRIGRFFAVDPLAPKYPHNSTYAFSENVVIDHVELEGLEKVDSDKSWNLTKDENASASGNYKLYGSDASISGTFDGKDVTVKLLEFGANKGNYIGFFAGNENNAQGDFIIGGDLITSEGFNITSSNSTDPAYANMLNWNALEPLLLSSGDQEIIQTPTNKYGINNYGQNIEFITYDTYGYYDWDFNGSPYIRIQQQVTDYSAHTSSSLNLDSYSLTIGSGVLKSSQLLRFGKFKPAPIVTGENYVYLAKNNNDVIYVGITNNIVRRSKEHASRFRIEPLIENLSRFDARAVEQVLINAHKLGKNGGTLLNKINSIAKTNPIYAESLRRGKEILDSINYAY